MPLDPGIRTAISEALAAAPPGLSRARIAARIRAAIPFGTDFPGVTIDSLVSEFAPGAPATSDHIGNLTESEVDRLTASWRNWPWQIRQEKPRSPAETLALDEVLLDAVGQGTHGPTLAFWQWTKPVLVLGRSQSVQNEVDVPSAQEHGFELARRISGGGAMLIEPEGAITYSLILPETAVAGLTIRQSYEVCDAWVVRGLRDLGLDAHYVPTNDMACSRGKIAGAAQARRRGAVLHHTTVAYSLDSDVMAKVLRIGRGKISARGVTSAAKCVAPLVLQTSHSREVIVARLVQSFQVRYGGEFTEETAEERRLAEQLAREKYSTAAWVHDIP